MTRKDYIKVAAFIKAAKNPDITIDDPVRFVAEGLAQLFFDDNPRFDATRFYRACGLIEEETKVA